MLPVLWQTLSLSLIRHLCTTFFSIVIFLLLLRAEEIARFAAMGASALETALLALYLIPMAMPLSLPLALLVSASSVTKRLCQSSELIALTTSGLSLWVIFTPLIYISLIVCLLNGWIASEWSAVSSLSVRKLKTKLSFLSPEKLSEKNPFLKIGSRLVFSMPSAQGNSRTLYVISGDNQHWALYQMQAMEKQGHEIKADTTTFMKIEKSPSGTLEKLQLENTKKSTFPSKRVPLIAKNFAPSYGWNHLNLKQLLSRYKTPTSSNLERASILHELMRRFFCLISPLATLLIGIYWSLSIDRKSRQKKLPILLIIFLIASYFFALHSPHIKTLSLEPSVPLQNIQYSLIYCTLLSALLFLVPLGACIATCYYKINKTNT